MLGELDLERVMSEIPYDIKYDQELNSPLQHEIILRVDWHRATNI